MNPLKRRVLDGSPQHRGAMTLYQAEGAGMIDGRRQKKDTDDGDMMSSCCYYTTTTIVVLLFYYFFIGKKKQQRNHLPSSGARSAIYLGHNGWPVDRMASLAGKIALLRRVMPTMQM